ncbi:MAG: protein phosphatase CheZ [Betaproteobacteria bacterium]|nr:protein phosphatase CheZ [Betaproteobacteria bacterium]
MNALAKERTSAPEFGEDDYDVFHRIGTLTRQLHDALRELGYDIHLQGAVGTLPDARSRLDYIARLTGEAADKVLNAVDGARLEQDRLDGRLAKLSDAWASLAGSDGPNSPTPSLVKETADYFADAKEGGRVIQGQLTDIMMAQDFHDLTGQVIRKIADLAMHLEEQLVKLLVASTPPERRGQVQESLEGPVVDGNRAEVVTNQAQVDDLLAELGF